LKRRGLIEEKRGPGDVLRKEPKTAGMGKKEDLWKEKTVRSGKEAVNRKRFETEESER